MIFFLKTETYGVLNHPKLDITRVYLIGFWAISHWMVGSTTFFLIVATLSPLLKAIMTAGLMI